jgi:hypothetical protein
MRKFLSDRVSSAHAQILIQQENKGELSGHSIEAHSPLLSPANHQVWLAPSPRVRVIVCACACVCAYDHNAPTLGYPTHASCKMNYEHARACMRACMPSQGECAQISNQSVKAKKPVANQPMSDTHALRYLALPFAHELSRPPSPFLCGAAG